MRVLSMWVILLAAGVVYGKPNNGYVMNEQNGISYRLKLQSQPWQKAKEKCEMEGAKLAVPKSEEEFSFIQKLVRGMSFHDVTGTDYRLLVWLGINNLDNYTTWRTLDGENIKDTGFSRWSGDNGNTFSDSLLEPRCAGLDAHNPGLRDFWCSHHQPYLCQMN